MLMILALLWLTISLPYVFESQQKMAKESKSMISDSSVADSNEEESASPVGAEEKNPGSNTSLSEEYLHDAHTDEHFFSTFSKSYKCVSSGIYIAYHGELDVPPPDAA
ncbi:MAG TPA: hypothetical protein VM935_18370 [Chitinophagaceae bacterium]|nr:hypothetical protein [Chitinophagaceae bacterium]